MKRPNILIALFGLLVFVGLSNAQTVTVALRNPSPDKEVTEVNFPAPANSRFLIFEAALPNPSEADCFASRDFSNAVLVGPERATVAYDPATGMFFLKNANTPSSI